jgi:hypothetical protein
MFTISSMLMLSILAAVIIATPNYVLALSKSNDNSNNNTKVRNFYLANSHNLTALNATGTLRDLQRY